MKKIIFFSMIIITLILLVSCQSLMPFESSPIYRARNDYIKLAENQSIGSLKLFGNDKLVYINNYKEIKCIDTNGKKLWTYTPAAGYVYNIAVNTNGMVAFFDYDTLRVLDKEGNLLFSKFMTNRSQIIDNSYDENIYVTGSASVVSYTRNGDKRWEVSYGNEFYGLNGKITGSGKVFLYGSKLHTIDTGGNKLWERSFSSNSPYLKIMDNNIYVSIESSIYKINEDTGEIIKTFYFEDLAYNYFNFYIYNDTDLVYQKKGNEISCIDMNTKAIKWNYIFSTASPRFYDKKDDNMYITGGNFFCFEKEGNIKWTIRFPDYLVELAIGDDYLYIARDNKLYKIKKR